VEIYSKNYSSFKFPGVFKKVPLPRQWVWDNKQYRDHSCSSDKKTVKNMECGEFTALLLSVSDAAS